MGGTGCPHVLAEPPGWNPEKGLEPAIPALGWSCETWFGNDREDVVVQRLRIALDHGPVPAGPMDFDYRTYFSRKCPRHKWLAARRLGSDRPLHAAHNRN